MIKTDLRDKAISGLTWNFAGTFAIQAITFIVGIILARLLSPYEYGLIGMLTIFLLLAQPFVDSGFSTALIRKNNCTEVDFSTVFYFNFIIGILFYIILFIAAPSISNFFNEPQLTLIIRVAALIIIIDAATIIQTTILIKAINFKRQIKISISASLISGILGIVLALRGMGVWSLVYRSIAQHILNSALLWYTNKWQPIKKFSWKSFNEMFAFGSNLLISAIIDKVYYNIYNAVIAKFFSAIELGLYSRADMFKSMVSSNISEIMAKTAYPVLSNLQDDPNRLISYYKKIFKTTFFITSIILLSIAAASKPLVLTLLGEKWVNTASYLQLLCFVGIFYPVHTLSRTLFYVYGKSKLFLNLQIVSKLLIIPAVVIGIFMGIRAMIIGMIVAGAVEYILKALYSGKITGYTAWQQTRDILPAFFISILIGSALFLIDHVMVSSSAITLLSQIGLGVILTITISEIFKIPEYSNIKGIIFSKISERTKLKL